MKKALVLGIFGQDSSYMAELLHSKGYEVYGVVKSIVGNKDRIAWIESLVPNVNLYAIDVFNKSELSTLINVVRPDEIYNFISSSNVFSAWEDLDYVMNIDARLPQHILECIVKTDKSIKYFQASSCLIFGHNADGIQNEETKPEPIHPYGVAKNYADNILKEFRRVHNIYACSGIFYNHESERRGENFFSKKITTAVANIKQGLQQTIKVGNLNPYRDYGYAPDYLGAVYLMMQNDKPTDYVIGTGKLITMMEFAKKCFDYAGLDYINHIYVDQALYREIDTNILKANATKIKTELGWKPKHSIDDMVKIMMDYQLNKINNKKI